MSLSPLDLLGTEALSPRLSELRLHSRALARETRVRVLLPGEGTEPEPGGLPVLFLLHGGGTDSDHTNWSAKGSAEALTEGLGLVVVMPEGGKGGWYSDWLQPETSEGTQRWETYHLGELLPFVRSHFATRADRDGTAVAGLSMGGFGAMHYAARHPDLFGFAASFSGAVDIRHPGVGRVVKVSPEIMGGRRGAIFGDHVADEMAWRAANPVDLAANLATVEVQLRTGNGQPGGPHGDGPEGDNQEVGVSQATASLHRRLVELGIDHLYDDYGPGAHTWPYWNAALAASLGPLMARTRRRPSLPVELEHLAYEPRFSVWGHRVERAGDELAPTVLRIGPGGPSLRGDRPGSARVVLPGGEVREVAVGPGA